MERDPLKAANAERRSRSGSVCIKRAPGNTTPMDYRKARWDALAIAAGGVFVGATPALWYSLVWPGSDSGIAFAGWLLVFAFSAAPFVLAALLRLGGQLRRLAGAVVTIVVAAWVVFGQVTGLDPGDTSSTGSIVLLVAPFYACAGVFCGVVIDRMAEAAASHWRRRLKGSS
jgi:hypothetical protein